MPSKLHANVPVEAGRDCRGVTISGKNGLFIRMEFKILCLGVCGVGMEDYGWHLWGPTTYIDRNFFLCQVIIIMQHFLFVDEHKEILKKLLK